MAVSSFHSEHPFADDPSGSFRRAVLRIMLMRSWCAEPFDEPQGERDLLGAGSFGSTADGGTISMNYEGRVGKM